ncbi:MAG: urate hydroxylase PuuD [Ferruginibacter sp.]
MNMVLVGALLFVLVILVVITYNMLPLVKQEEQAEDTKKRILDSQTFIYAGILLVILLLLICIYIYIKGTIYEGHMMEWLNIIVRLMHITFGIAWIGASFYFVFLENALNRTENVRDELAGNLWAIHGGGFYYLEKYKVAPKQIPRHLHWFKYEAYFTWLSGFCLLFIVYYFNAGSFLIDKNVLDISALQGIAIGIGSFVVAWILYDLLCRSALIKNGYLFTIIGTAILIGFAYFYAHVFNNRAAYIHFGAMLGTIMAANVFFIIIPAQKAMVKAAKEGKPLNPELGKHAGLRSLHNNYFTLPVLFVMISNHFPSTFGNAHSWVVLAVISLGAAGVKHWLNLRERGQYSVWVLPASVIILLAAAFITAPQKPTTECKPNIGIAEINRIVNDRCISCHSSKPTDDLITAPPNGITYETPQQIVLLKDKIMQRVVITKTMPQNNKTNMTEDERNTMRCWIEQGAQVK